MFFEGILIFTFILKPTLSSTGAECLCSERNCRECQFGYSIVGCPEKSNKEGSRHKVVIAVFCPTIFGVKAFIEAGIRKEVSSSQVEGWIILFPV